VIATVNTKGKISTVLNMFGMAYALKLCAIADYKKDTYKFGYGL
jgi:mitochondrial import receptor subunit TOM40